MLQEHVHLLPRLLEQSGATPAMMATRDGFGEALLELGEKDPRVVVVCADLAESTRVLGDRKSVV